MRRRGKQPGASRAKPQMNKCFDVMRLRKKVKKLDGADFIFSGVRVCAGLHAFGLQKNRKISREGRGIAGKVDNFRRLQLAKFGCGRLAQARTRRIENNNIWFFAELLQKLFSVQIVRSDRNSSSFRICAKVADCRFVCVDADDPMERLCER